jgi:hypothetical protein
MSCSGVTVRPGTESVRSDAPWVITACARNDSEPRIDAATVDHVSVRLRVRRQVATQELDMVIT